MAKTMQSVVRAVDRNGERWLLLVLYTAIVLVVVLEVLRRFLLSYSSVWGGEAARYLFIYLAWIGASAAVRDRAHIRISTLLENLPPRAQAVVYLIGDLMTLVLACIALYWSLGPIGTSLKFGSVTEGLQISRAWFLAAVPLGFLMMMFRLLQSMARDLVDLRRGSVPFGGHKLFE